MTFAATANAIVYVGARPVFIDVSTDSWTLDPGLLEEELSVRARRGKQAAAVIAVDLYGECADYAALSAICSRFHVPFIEDAAEALGSTHRGANAGTFGECAAFSFNGNKIITTSGGGMLVSRSRSIVERARHLAAQARDEAPHYQHSEIGYNYRLSNLLAAVGRGQLKSLPAKIARRRAVNQEYKRVLSSLAGVSFMPESSHGVGNNWLTCITVAPREFGASREDIRVCLARENIESRPLWKPMHLQPVFDRAPMRRGAVSEDLFDRGLCLPSGSSLTADEQARVIQTLISTPVYRARERDVAHA
jgi:dTDP-4-amino-4,6-dideoxygalactose transaminase